MKEKNNNLKPFLISVGIVAALSAIWLSVLIIFPAKQVHIPGNLPDPRTVPVTARQTVTSPVPTPSVQSPTPKPKETVIYAIAYEIPEIYQIQEVFAAWNKADSFVEFKEAKVCPRNVQCLYLKLGKLPNSTAAETRFGVPDSAITITFNRNLLQPFATHSTACHEVGHVLGLPHISGTVNTCMTAKDGFYRVRPTSVDTRLVNSYGPWEFWKMYDLSGKDVDVRNAPK